MIVVDGFQEMPDEFMQDFIMHEREVAAGTYSAFNNSWKPLIEQERADIVMVAVGVDHVPQVLYSATDSKSLRFWDACKKIDALETGSESGDTGYLVCRTKDDLDTVLRTGKTGFLLTIAGGKPLEGKPNLNLLSSLRTLHRAGLRCLQLTGGERNRLCDGVAQERTGGGLASFGVSVVAEARRLGMLLDTSHVSRPGFFDVCRLWDGALIDSHTACRALVDHPANLDDGRLAMIGSSGGVVGITLRAAQVASKGAEASLHDVVDHVCHAVEVAGIDHVGIGACFASFKVPVRRDVVQGYANLGPDFCSFNRATPVQSEKYPGWCEGLWQGIRSSDFAGGCGDHATMPALVDAIRARGFSEAETCKIAGGNWLGLYRRMLPA